MLHWQRALVDEDVVVLAGQHDGAVIGERDAVAARVLPAAFKGRDDAAVGVEHRHIEVGVVVRDDDVPVGTDSDADREVGNAMAADRAFQQTAVAEHLDNVGKIEIIHEVKRGLHQRWMSLQFDRAAAGSVVPQQQENW